MGGELRCARWLRPRPAGNSVPLASPQHRDLDRRVARRRAAVHPDRQAPGLAASGPHRDARPVSILRRRCGVGILPARGRSPRAHGVHGQDGRTHRPNTPSADYRGRAQKAADRRRDPRIDLGGMHREGSRPSRRGAVRRGCDHREPAELRTFPLRRGAPRSAATSSSPCRGRRPAPFRTALTHLSPGEHHAVFATGFPRGRGRPDVGRRGGSHQSLPPDGRLGCRRSSSTTAPRASADRQRGAVHLSVPRQRHPEASGLGTAHRSRQLRSSSIRRRAIVRPPTALAFLAAGERPIYVGFARRASSRIRWRPSVRRSVRCLGEGRGARNRVARVGQPGRRGAPPVRCASHR